MTEYLTPIFPVKALYSQTSTNGHLSTMATSQQWTLFLADSPYIHSCLNLSSTATFFCRQAGR